MKVKVCNFEHPSRLLILVKLTHADNEILPEFLSFCSLLQGVAG